MSFSSDYRARQDDIAALFERAFAASEGDEEGAVIGKLAKDLMQMTSSGDIFVYLAQGAGKLTGAIIFTRVTYSEDARSVFVLGPVAVVPEMQGQGVGQALLRHGLDGLREAGVDIALTYGDPNYYGKVGFAPISEADVAAPYPLQYPQGWLGQSLDGVFDLPVKGACTCVPAFQDPAYW